MVKRILLLVVACAACATVADVEVNRPIPGGGEGDRDGDGNVEDGGAPTTTDGDGGAGTDAPSTPDESAPDPFACGCDAGFACCVRTSAANGTCDVPSACTEPGSLVVGCTRSSINGRDCCWRPDGGITQAVFTAGCEPSTAACQNATDCAGHGDTCTTLTCKGVLFGVCASPAPSWFVCPP
jgi:hypothetical protein